MAQDRLRRVIARGLRLVRTGRSGRSPCRPAWRRGSDHGSRVNSRHETFKPQLFVVQILGRSFNQPSRDSQYAADYKNATLVFAILGGATGLSMGLAGGLAGRSVSRGIKVGSGALLIGSLVGAAASLALVPLFFQGLVPDRSGLLWPVMLHGSIWTAIAAVGGLAFAIGMRCRQCAGDVVAGACFGALLATICFHARPRPSFPIRDPRIPLRDRP